jgi:hypothetical protein
MAFVRLGSDYIKESYTQIDNIFLLSYLPNSDAIDVSIYLYGLTLANIKEEDENQIEKMAICLRVSEEKIMSSYKYWEKKGLVSISKTNPPLIKYLSVKHPLTPIVKLNTQKYSAFLEEIERLFPNKIFVGNESSAFIELMESSKMELNAMLLIIQYCNDFKGGNASTPYILAVANAWINEGLLTEKQVDEHIQELENNSEAIRTIFKALSITRSANLDDRQLYLNWINKLNYRLDAILVAAKAQKRKGGMERLDKYLNELYKANAYTPTEIALYTGEKEKLRELATNITKNLGAYYGDLDIIIETYLNNWLYMGFEAEALLKLAKFCFMTGIKNYDGLDQKVADFHKKGLLTEKSIDDYITAQLINDQKIREMFDLCNYDNIINNKDRNNYRTWIEWGFGDDIINYVATQYKDKPFPMQSINRTLSSLHNKGIKTAKEAEKELDNGYSGDQKPKDDFKSREYTEEQLKSVLIDFKEWND